MNKKSKILIKVFFLLVLASAITIYYKYIIIKDFEVVGPEIEVLNKEEKLNEDS